MENQILMPATQEPTQEAQPWHDRFYNALTQAFPNAVYHQLKNGDSRKTSVSWTAEDTVFIVSWFPLEPDEIKFINDNMNDSTDTPLTNQC